MNEIVIVGGVRTPIGSHGGGLRDVSPQELAKIVIQEVMKRTELDAHELDDVIFGCCGQFSDAPNVARVAALMAGIPARVPGYTVQRNCVSGMLAVTNACQAIKAGDGEAFLVGGTESMSYAPYTVRGARWGLKLRSTEFVDVIWEGLTDPVCNMIMGYTAENLALLYGITRREQDEFAVQSHRKAFMATRMGKFKDEIVPVPVIKRVAGQEVAREEITQDENINAGLTVEADHVNAGHFDSPEVISPTASCA